MYGCLSLSVSPAMNWRFIHTLPFPLSSGIGSSNPRDPLQGPKGWKSMATYHIDNSDTCSEGRFCSQSHYVLLYIYIIFFYPCRVLLFKTALCNGGPVQKGCEWLLLTVDEITSSVSSITVAASPYPVAWPVTVWWRVRFHGNYPVCPCHVTIGLLHVVKVRPDAGFKKILIKRDTLTR